ncbi:MAG TPA: biotin/lipoyl-binding protein [Firmicutes bacterium]|nr:biotin/lipoyl-binding protein [Bacillota bacterium]
MKRYKVTVNGKTYEVEVEEIGGGIRATAVTPVAELAPAAPPAPAPAPAAPQTADTGDGEIIRAPLPGVITEYKVKAGERVKRGQVLLLLEAMKMQNEIMAPRDALVKSIDNNQGANVNTGDRLLTLE